MLLLQSLIRASFSCYFSLWYQLLIVVTTFLFFLIVVWKGNIPYIVIFLIIFNYFSSLRLKRSLYQFSYGNGKKKITVSILETFGIQLLLRWVKIYKNLLLKHGTCEDSRATGSSPGGMRMRYQQLCSPHSIVPSTEWRTSGACILWVLLTFLVRVWD